MYAILEWRQAKWPCSLQTRLEGSTYGMRWQDKLSEREEVWKRVGCTRPKCRELASKLTQINDQPYEKAHSLQNFAISAHFTIRDIGDTLVGRFLIVFSS